MQFRKKRPKKTARLRPRPEARPEGSPNVPPEIEQMTGRDWAKHIAISDDVDQAVTQCAALTGKPPSEIRQATAIFLYEIINKLIPSDVLLLNQTLTAPNLADGVEYIAKIYGQNEAEVKDEVIAALEKKLGELR